MFLLLPNPAHCTAAGEPTSQPTCWAVEAECPEGERGSPEMWMIFHMLYLWRNHISISNSKLSTHLPIFILGTLTRITTRCDFWVRWFFFHNFVSCDIRLWVLYVRAMETCVCASAQHGSYCFSPILYFSTQEYKSHCASQRCRNSLENISRSLIFVSVFGLQRAGQWLLLCHFLISLFWLALASSEI